MCALYWQTFPRIRLQAGSKCFPNILRLRKMLWPKTQTNLANAKGYFEDHSRKPECPSSCSSDKPWRGLRLDRA
jgi:hypothetical protein